MFKMKVLLYEYNTFYTSKISGPSLEWHPLLQPTATHSLWAESHGTDEFVFKSTPQEMRFLFNATKGQHISAKLLNNHLQLATFDFNTCPEPILNSNSYSKVSNPIIFTDDFFQMSGFCYWNKSWHVALKLLLYHYIPMFTGNGFNNGVLGFTLRVVVSLLITTGLSRS